MVKNGFVGWNFTGSSFWTTDWTSWVEFSAAGKELREVLIADGDGLYCGDCEGRIVA